MKSGIVDQHGDRAFIGDAPESITDSAFIAHIAHHAGPNRASSTTGESIDFVTSTIQFDCDGSPDPTACPRNDAALLKHL